MLNKKIKSNLLNLELKFNITSYKKIKYERNQNTDLVKEFKN